MKNEEALEIGRMLTETVTRFVAENYAFEQAHERREANPFGKNWQAFSEMGWLGVVAPQELGGSGLGLAHLVQMIAKLGAGLTEEPFLDGVVLSGRLIDKAANEPIRSELITNIVDGSEQFCLCHREAISEFQFDGIATRAETNPDGYKLNGRKRSIACAAWATRLLVTAVFDNRLELFLVPADAPGVRIEASFQAMDGKEWSDVVFDNVIIKSDYYLTRDCKKFLEVLTQSLLAATAGLCAEAAGIATALREETGEYLKMRKQFGATLSSFQALQHRFADMFIMETEIWAAARLAAEALDAWQGQETEIAIRKAKARVGQLGRKIAEEAVQLHGGMGQTEELKIGHFLRRLLVIDAQMGRTQEHLIWIAQNARFENAPVH